MSIAFPRAAAPRLAGVTFASMDVVFLLVWTSMAVLPPVMPQTQLFSDLDSVSDWDVLEAVFRWQAANYESDFAKVYFLTFGRHSDDLPGAFIERFDDLAMPCEPLSEATGFFHGVKSRQTGDDGIVFVVERVEWQTSRRAIVWGGYHVSGLAASGDMYAVERHWERWLVTRHRNIWRS